MAKIIFAFFIALSAAGSAQAAMEPWSCELHGTLHGTGGLLITGNSIVGLGVATCKNSTNGEEASQLLNLTISGFAPASGLRQLKSVDIEGYAIPAAEGADSLLGSYSLSASLGNTLSLLGIHFDAAIQATRPEGGAFELGLLGVEAPGIAPRLAGSRLALDKR